jgi:hypothetical protein
MSILDHDNEITKAADLRVRDFDILKTIQYYGISKLSRLDDVFAKQNIQGLLLIPVACSDRFGRISYEGEEYHYLCGEYVCTKGVGLQVKHLGKSAW